MRPLLFEIGDLRFHSYPAAVALAFLVGMLLIAREGMRQKAPLYIPIQGAWTTLLGGLIGGKVFHILQYSEPRYLWRAVIIWEGGLVFYGGAIGAVVFSLAYLYFTKTLDWRMFDVAAPFAALGQAFGRVGCFLNSCCWGEVCDYRWAVAFPKNSHPYNDHVEHGWITRIDATSLPVHPTQLYSVAGLLAIFAFLLYRLRKGSPFTFAIALQYFMLYGVMRFIIEFFRGDSARSVFGLTVSQVVSLLLIVGAGAAYAVTLRWRRLNRASRSEAVASAE